MAPEELTAVQVKAKARELGVQLAGIADAAALAAEPHPPEAVLRGARSVVVLGRRMLWGAARAGRSDLRSPHYAAELAISELEEAALHLAFFLEDHGYPSLILPAASSRSHQEDMAADGPFSLTHAAVAAGLGTLGLNGMLLTPEFGPRVTLCGVVSLASLAPDTRIEQALCRGESCGRCLLACPGDAIDRWKLDVEACRPHSSPYGYWFFQRHVERILEQPDVAHRLELARSTDSLMIWQSMLRGVGVITGCTRCQDVCPVGADYEAHLSEALESIPEATAAKRDRLDEMRDRATAGDRGPDYERSRVWVGELPPLP